MIFSTASQPFTAYSTVKPSSSRRVMAISRLRSLSSTSRMRLWRSRWLGSTCWVLASWAAAVAPSHASCKVSSTVNEVPLPWVLFTEIVPCIMSTRFFVMAMSSPVPWMPLMVEVRSRSKGSKMCSTNSGLMPMPVSDTVKR